MIRKAEEIHIEPIMLMTNACARAMIAQGVFQWNEHYPDVTAFENDIKRNELYVLEVEGEVKGSIVISTLMDEEYIPIKWYTDNKNNIYVHRLAIHPDFQGKGYATESANATLEIGFNNLKIEEIIGRASLDNIASIRVLEKTGMSFWKKDSCKGIENSVYYKMNKTQYNKV